MTAAVGSLPAQSRATFDLFATCAALAFLLLIGWPAYQYAQEETFITTPALSLNNAWRAAALPSGIALMSLFALLRIARAGSLRSILISVGTVAVIVAAFWLAAPLFLTLGNLNLLIFFVGVVAAHRLCRRADRLRVRPCHLRLPGADDAYAAHGPDRAHGRGHEPSHPAGRAAVRLSRPAHRDDRHGARHGRAFWQACSAMCAAGCTMCWSARCIWCPASRARRPPTWPRSRRCCFPEMKAARRQARRPGRAAGGDRRADRDHPAEPGPDHHRLGDRRIDRRAVHRRAVARRGARRSCSCLVVAGAIGGKTSATCKRATGAADRPHLRDRAAGAGAAVPDPRRRGRRRRHRHRGFDDRHRLFGDRRARSSIAGSTGGGSADAGGDRVLCRARSCSSSARRPAWPGR